MWTLLTSLKGVQFVHIGFPILFLSIWTLYYVDTFHCSPHFPMKEPPFPGHLSGVDSFRFSHRCHTIEAFVLTVTV